MTSYVYNPSKKVTELLSTFLEFDPKQLQLGIWAGDLALRDVNLKRDSFYPLLNQYLKAERKELPPLHLKLLKGSIGHMRIQIPWKRLVWGEGDVKLQISDVTIVLAIESREETKARAADQVERDKPAQLEETAAEDEVDLEFSLGSKSTREIKQEWLRDAERRHLQGLPIPSKPIDKSAVDQSKEQESSFAGVASAGRLERWLKIATSSLTWRFFAGLQATVRNVRIVIVENGVEIGAIIHSIDVRAAKQEETKDATIDKDVTVGVASQDHSSESSQGPSTITPPPNIIPEGEFEDGEHVDKTVKVRGFGFFVRREGYRTQVLPAMQFTSSVAADDFVLRPTELDAGFSFFYPYPPGKKKRKTALVEGTPEVTAPSVVDTSSADSSKVRRSKRDKRRNASDGSTADATHGTTTAISAIAERPPKVPRTGDKRASSTYLTNYRGMQSMRQFLKDPIHPMGNRAKSHTVTDFAPVTPTHRRIGTDMSNTAFTARSVPLLRTDDVSTARSRSVEKSLPVHSPHVDLTFTFGEIKTICASQHYELVHVFNSSLVRKRNGRPDKTIASCVAGERSGMTRSVVVDAPISADADVQKYAAAHPMHLEDDVLLRPPLHMFKSPEQQKSTRRLKLHLHLQLPVVNSERSDVTRAWWRYAFAVVLFEIRERNKQKHMFVEKILPFDWERQKYRRKEYVDMYISTRLEPTSVLRSVELKVLSGSRSAEEKLLKIEDELPIEQILLYRAIARALRVRGMRTMPSSLSGLHGDRRLYSASTRQKRASIQSQNPNGISRLRYGVESASNLGVDGAMAATQAKASFGTDYENNEKYLASLQRAATEARRRRGLHVDGGSASAGVALSPPRPEHANPRDPAGQYNSSGAPEIERDWSPDIRQGRDIGPSYVRSALPKYSAPGRVSGDDVGNLDFDSYQLPDGHTEGHSSRGVNGSTAHDARTFKTARTNKSSLRGKKSISHVEQNLRRNTVRFSLSISFASLELMVYMDRYRQTACEASMMAGSPQLPRSTLTNVDDDDGAASDLSDLSILSDDQMFFNHQSDVSSIPEDESIEEPPILSSSDFLLFGMPNNVLLKVLVSPMTCKVGFRAGASPTVSLCVGHILITGHDTCHLLSVGSARPLSLEPFSPPFEEIQMDRRKSWKKDSLGSTNGSDYTQAIVLSMVSVDEGVNLQCDICDIKASIEFEATMRVLRFFSETHVTHPKPLLEVSLRQQLRLYMIRRKAASTSAFGRNSAFRINGVNIVSPCSTLENADSIGRVAGTDPSMSSQGRVEIRLTSKLIELYTGSYVDDICAAATELMDDKTSKGEDRSKAYYSINSSFPDGTVELPSAQRNLKMLNITDVISAQRPLGSRYSVIAVSDINCEILPLGEHSTSGTINLLQLPANVEILIMSGRHSVSNLPTQTIVAEVSPVRLLVSANRVDILARFLLSLQTVMSLELKPPQLNSDPKREKPQPRLEILANHIVQTLSIHLSKAEVALVDDVIDTFDTTSQAMKEIIMEESVSDYLSVLACFDLYNPVKEALATARQLCLDRLGALGLDERQSRDCVAAARLNFLGDIEMLKKTQSMVIQELSGVRHDMRGTNPMPMTMPTVDDLNLGYTFDECESSTNNESDDDSEESIDIVETTMRNAVERTMTAFVPYLHEQDTPERPPQTVISLELINGGNVSLTRTFYDLFMECRVESIIIANPAGIHILRAGNHLTSPSDGGSGLEDSDGFPPIAPGSVSCENPSDSPGRRIGCRDAVIVTFFQLDGEYEFGAGGEPIAILGNDEETRNVNQHEREHLTDVTIGAAEFTFSQKLFSDALEAMSKLRTSALKKEARVEFPESTKDANVRSSFVASAEWLSVLLASNELAPFSRINFDDISIDDVNSHLNRPHISLQARSCILLNLTPEGQCFPEVLSMLESGVENTAATKALRLQFIRSVKPWSMSSELLIDFTGVRVFVVRQYVNELMQYFVSDEYGVGFILGKMGGVKIADYLGNPPPPLRYRVAIVDSTIILPCNSTSMDLVAVEVAEVIIQNEYCSSTFALPTHASNLVISPCDLKEATQHEVPQRSPTEFDFYDCLDSGEAMRKDDFLPTSIFSKEWIRRIRIDLTKLRIYTSLAKTSGNLHGFESPILPHVYCMNGRPAPNKSVYTRQPEAEAILHSTTETLRPLLPQTPARKWEEITTSPSSLQIIAEFAPHLRLLISDGLETTKVEKGTLPLNLEMRISQFCLLLSIWYSNMQELPTMFPYAQSQVMGAARAPQPPIEFPEYGTHAYVRWLKDLSSVKSEIVCLFASLNVRCSFDESEEPQGSPGRDGVDEAQAGLTQNMAFQILLKDCIFHIANDQYGILRLGAGASSLELKDDRKSAPFESVIAVQSQSNQKVEDRLAGPKHRGVSSTWADLSWGLDCDGNTLSTYLPQPFQLSVFMTPGWCLVNLGFEGADAVFVDFSPIWICLDYFTSYFKSAAYGNPIFEVLQRKVKLKRSLNRENAKDQDDEKQGSLNMDFRLWLLHPYLYIPSSVVSTVAPCLRVESEKGFWYHYKSIGSYSSQEMGSIDMSVIFAKEFQSPTLCRSAHDSASPDIGTHTLMEGFSFGLRMDSNSRSNHRNIAVRVPFLESHLHDPRDHCSVTSPELEVVPVTLSLPTVCTPVVQPARFLGSTVCELILMLEILPMASSLILNFLSGPSASSTVDTCQASVGNIEDMKSVESADDMTTPTIPSFAVTAHVASLRLYAIDPVLGKHLPVAVVSISSIDLTASQLGSAETGKTILGVEAASEDLHVTLETHLWADYFKLGVTRSWEPLLEPFKFEMLFEKSRRRGQGLSLNSDSAFHVNITGALLLTLDEVISSFSRSISETFGTQAKSRRKTLIVDKASSQYENAGASIEHQFRSDISGALDVRHQIPRPVGGDDRVAFSFLNLTGQRLRVHQLAGQTRNFPATKAVVTYLNHVECTTLSFEATISVTRNLQVIEVPFPGLPNSPAHIKSMGSTSHTIDVQIPGFRWLRGISVDTSGRKFDNLVPRSPVVMSKIKRDWRLGNSLNVLTEVGLENGGRLITVRSLFEIRNNTSHPIALTVHPDPRHKPVVMAESDTSPATKKNLHLSIERNDGDQSHSLSDMDHLQHIDPGAAFQIPTLLLYSALQLEGSHLGCFWIRPVQSEANEDLEEFMMPKGSQVEFCSRPIQLAKLVHESALIFQNSNGEDLPIDKARSGVQVSCSISDATEGTPMAPFCYVIEIRRSPVVRSSLCSGLPGDRMGVENGLSKLKSQPDWVGADGGSKFHSQDSETRPEFVHGPVSYSLFIHPPLVIENLLPKSGRFELMHATRRIVLWFADLKPGERVPVHNVGLDAPLLLSVNLGFCRTPVGEGALVHHGSDSTDGKGMSSQQHGGLKSIGKVVTKGTKQIGKTLTAIVDSPDKRGQGMLSLVQNAQYQRASNRPRKYRAEKSSQGRPLGLDTGVNTGDGKVHSMANRVFSPEDVVSETIVVDSVGQRLTLKIENVRGGGGQRRIALFCPFWIVNTTEHPLRYKQEKSSFYVSGTVASPSIDGSRPVDGSNRNYVSRSKLFSPQRRLDDSASRPVMRRGTIFAGTPGALAITPGRCIVSSDKVATLIDKDMPLHRLASLAFMFNFHEEVLSIGHQRFCVQLADGTRHSRYVSDWSHGFSLDSVGVNQVVSMHCKDGRALEVSVTISVAPGFLSAYTKVVRFTPRFVLVNQLNRPIRIWQDSSLFQPNYDERAIPEEMFRGPKDFRKWRFKDKHDRTDIVNQYECLFGRPPSLDESKVDGSPVGTTANRSALYIASAAQSELLPFHLPDTRGERQLRIDLGGTWNLTPSFSADATGEHTFPVNRAFDLRLLRHVTTRASPQYTITLPPPDGEEIDPWDGELGVWFETDWGGDRRIIVKGTKRGRYSFNHTDIHVGDELLRIDDVIVYQMTFAETMKLLKERLTIVSVSGKGDIQKSERTRSRASIMNRWQTRPFTTNTENGDEFGLLSRNETDSKLVLTFRTLEERLRRVRMKASRSRKVDATLKSGPVKSGKVPLLDMGLSEEDHLTKNDSVGSDLRDAPREAIKVELRMLHHSIFVVVRPQEMDQAPFRIENRAMNHVVFFRQRGCNGHPWHELKPGESKFYSWEEPMRPKKLIVRVGLNNMSLDKKELFAVGDNHDSSCAVIGDVLVKGSNASGIKAKRGSRAKQVFSFLNVDNEEQAGFGASRTVKLEEIGFRDMLPCPVVKEGTYSSSVLSEYLNCQVDTDGATRVMIISDNGATDDERAVMQEHLSTLKRKISDELKTIERLTALKSSFIGNDPQEVPVNQEAQSGVEGAADDCADTAVLEKKKVSFAPTQPRPREPHADKQALTDVAEEARRLVDYAEKSTITHCNQVVVQVLEAAGLKASDVSGLCNPYCEIHLQGRLSARHSLLAGKVHKRKTYYIEKTVAPIWTEQIFVFDVPREAVHVTRGHSLQIRIRNFRLIGQHSDLGQTTVHLRSLRNQEELVGWYPLVGRTSRRELDSLANWGRGSVKLRVQWIYTVPALLDYFAMLSERRLSDLRLCMEGMKGQLLHAIETENKRKEHMDAFSQVRIPNLLALGSKGKQKIQSGHTRRVTFDDGGDYGHRLANWNGSSYRDTLKISRDRQLSSLYFQTAESRRQRLNRTYTQRMSQSNVSQGTRKGVEETTEFVHDEVHAILADGCPILKDDNDTDGDGCTSRAQGTSITNDLAQNTHVSMCAGYDGQLSKRGSGGDTSCDRRDQKSEEAEVKQDMFEFSRRSRFLSHREGPRERQNSFEVETGSGITGGMLLTCGPDDEADRVHAIDELYKRGLLHHRCDWFLHRDHLTHRFRRFFLDSSLATHINTASTFRSKSKLHLSSSIRQFQSWTAACAVFNDTTLNVSIVDNSFQISINSSVTQESSHRPLTESVSVEELEDTQKLNLGVMLLPSSAPPSMLLRARAHENDLLSSRRQFERACTRSLKAVLNPGGWLTIRPLTALNLPDTYTGMFVKLRYGLEVAVTDTVDARVAPTWTFDEVQPFTPSSLTSDMRPCLPSTKKNYRIPRAYENDLQVYVEPQETSGSIRISVVGERLNSKVELGVLDIPLGAAISCCVECMENSNDERPGIHSSLESVVPAYDRWFPLMSPKDSVAVDGDMGLSARPNESEKVRDSMFNQYFTPCIRLALIWQPEEQELAPTQTNTTSRSETDKSAFNLNVTTEASLTNTYFNADISLISAALIDSQRAMELISVSAADIDIRYSVTRSKTRAGLVIGWIQIDHQDDQAREPVVLAPTPVEHAQPTLQFLAVKDNLRSKSNIESYEYIGVTLQEMDLTLEESWMFDVWEFIISLVRRKDVKKKTFQNVEKQTVSNPGSWSSETRALPRGNFLRQPTESVSPTLLELLNDEGLQSVGMSKKVYVEQLLLGYIKINISYFKGKKTTWEVTDRGGFILKGMDGMVQSLPEMAIAAGGMLIGTSRRTGDGHSSVFDRWSEHTHDEDLWTDTGDKYSNLPNLIAAVFPSVSDAPVRLQGKVIEHVFESPTEIINSIKVYYVNETLKQIYKIIGSLDFVGNPTMVLNSFVTGVRDFFVTPSQEFLRTPNNPSRVGIGVAKGTLSLLSHSASGLFGFAAKMTATAGQAAANLSFDADYQQWHRDMVLAEAKSLNRQWKKRGAQSLSAMVTRPLYDIFHGLVLGTTGIITSPYKGARKDGGAGFAKGVAIGAVGILTKPVVGVLDAFAHFTGSIHDIAKSVNVLEKRYQPARKLRLAHAFGLKNVLMPFDHVTAKSVHLLKMYPMKTRRVKVTPVDQRRPDMGRNEIHVASEVLNMEPGVETYAVVTTHRVVLFKVKKDGSGSLTHSLCWEVDLTRGQAVSSRIQDQGHNGVALVIATRALKTVRSLVSSSPTAEKQDTKPESLPTVVSANKNMSQTSFFDAASQPSTLTLGDGIDDDSQALGTQFSQVWEELRYNSESSNRDGVDGSGAQLYLSAQGRGGEVLEWFTVLAEFQQRKQLSRLHNAICCLTGDYGAIIYDRGLGHPGSLDGYTSFGELAFGLNDTNIGDEPVGANNERIVYEVLEKLPWMYTSIFRRLQNLNPQQQRNTIAEMRKSWVFSNELDASSEDKGPIWFVSARAKAAFVPEEAPPLPPSVRRRDDVVVAIKSQLEQGNISYNQACELVKSHSQARLVAIDDVSVQSSALGDRQSADVDVELKAAAAGSDCNDDLDVFQSLNMEDLDRFSQEIRKFEQLPNSNFPKRDSLVSEDPVDWKSTAQLGESSHSRVLNEQESSFLKRSAAIDEELSLPLSASHSSSTQTKHHPERRDKLVTELSFSAMQSFDSPSLFRGKPVVEHPRHNTDLGRGAISVCESHAETRRSVSPNLDSRLERLEMMIEELLDLNTRHQTRNERLRNFRPATTIGADDPAVAALRQEIEELRAQVQATVTKNDRDEMIASLRAEVRLLKHQLDDKSRKVTLDVKGDEATSDVQ